MASMTNTGQSGLDNNFEKDMQEVLSEDDDYGNMGGEGGGGGPRRSQSHPGGGRPQPPSSLPVRPGSSTQLNPYSTVV